VKNLEEQEEYKPQRKEEQSSMLETAEKTKITRKKQIQGRSAVKNLEEHHEAFKPQRKEE
jgi:hypothetical protein